MVQFTSWIEYYTALMFCFSPPIDLIHKLNRLMLDGPYNTEVTKWTPDLDLPETMIKEKLSEENSDLKHHGKKLMILPKHDLAELGIIIARTVTRELSRQKRETSAISVDDDLQFQNYLNLHLLVPTTDLNKNLDKFDFSKGTKVPKKDDLQSSLIWEIVQYIVFGITSLILSCCALYLNYRINNVQNPNQVGSNDEPAPAGVP